jgi:hypothetical protein
MQELSWKKILVVGLKGLDAKTNWLAVNRQSKSDFVFEGRLENWNCEFRSFKRIVEEELEVGLWRLSDQKI